MQASLLLTAVLKWDGAPWLMFMDDTIRAYDAEPDEFHARSLEVETPSEIPANLDLHTPCYEPAAPEKPGLRNPTYDTLDTNAGARTMAFTHTPIPPVNSVASIRKFGRNNSTRPRQTVLEYIETLFQPYYHLLCLGTAVEKLEKSAGGSWILTLRRRGVHYGSGITARDYWWQEAFDAVVVASGHFTVAKVPEIQGLEETAAQFPGKFEHSKSFRSRESYVGKVRPVL